LISGPQSVLVSNFVSNTLLVRSAPKSSSGNNRKLPSLMPSGANGSRSCGSGRSAVLAERGLSRRRRTEPERFHRYAGFLRLEASLVLLRLEGSLARLIAEAAESPRRRLSGSSPIPPSGSGMVVLSHPPNESAVPPAA